MESTMQKVAEDERLLLEHKALLQGILEGVGVRSFIDEEGKNE